MTDLHDSIEEVLTDFIPLEGMEDDNGVTHTACSVTMRVEALVDSDQSTLRGRLTAFLNEKREAAANIRSAAASLEKAYGVDVPTATIREANEMALVLESIADAIETLMETP